MNQGRNNRLGHQAKIGKASAKKPPGQLIPAQILAFPHKKPVNHARLYYSQ